MNDENKFAEILGYSINEMNNKTFLFSSGMATITSLFYCLSTFVKGTLDIQASIGYYETKYFLKLIASMGNKVNLDLQLNTKSNVFYFEPIKYDASLSVTNISLLIKAINTSKATLKFVIIDSTMHNRTRIIERMQEMIKDTSNIIFLTFGSGLKIGSRRFGAI